MSSPRYYPPPLIRRLLPWMYLGLFCLAAPVLVFYTSGYRYNLKKGLIERNGTLIIDSTPKNANVFINDQDTGEKTPITLQNMVPGWQRLRVSRPGYSAWEQSLFIRPQRVSFAHEIWLWKDSRPEFIAHEQILQLQSDPLLEKFALLTPSTTSSPVSLRFWSPQTGFRPAIRLPERTNTDQPLELEWREDGQVLLLREVDGGQAWWTSYRQATNQGQRLPNGSYHWAKNELVGHDGTSVIRLDPIRQRVERTPLAPDQLAQSTDLELQASSSTQQRVLVDHSLLTRLFLLPNGRWEFSEIQRPFVLLKDEMHRWLSIQLSFGQSHTEQLVGDRPRWNPTSDTPNGLFLQAGELWNWQLDKEPTLLWRQAKPLVQALWHRSGTHVVFADQHEVKVINLHDPLQSMHVLATFDRIQDMAFLERTLYIAGTRDGKEGLWRLVIE